MEDFFDINCLMMIKLEISPEECVEYLENKEAVTIHPVHVKALLILRHPAVASS